MLENPLTWGAVIVALGSIVAAVKFWMDMGATKRDAESARESASDAHKRIDKLSETSATTADIAAAEKRFADAVSGLRADFRDMASRLDSVLVALVKKA